MTELLDRSLVIIEQHCTISIGSFKLSFTEEILNPFEVCFVPLFILKNWMELKEMPSGIFKLQSCTLSSTGKPFIMFYIFLKAHNMYANCVLLQFCNFQQFCKKLDLALGFFLHHAPLSFLGSSKVWEISYRLVIKCINSG